MSKSNILTIDQFILKFFIGEKEIDPKRAESFYKEYIMYAKSNVSFEKFKTLITGRS